MCNVFCSQNCKNSGEPVEGHPGFHGCTKEDLKLNNLEKRSGCKYCPSFERVSGKKKKE